MGGKVLELETDKILEQALERGLEQGLEKATVRFVKNMLAENESPEKICLYTGCSMDQVLQIKEHMTSNDPLQEPPALHRPGRSR